MTCDNERAKVDRLVDDHLMAQADCRSGIKSQCAVANGLLKDLASARAALEKCLSTPAPTPSPTPTPTPDPPPTPPAPTACAAEQVEVDRLMEEYRLAQSDCHNGIKSQCAVANGLLKDLVRAREALHRCQNPAAPAAPISNLTIVGIERTQSTQFFQSNGQGSFGSAQDNKVPLVANKTLALRVYVDQTSFPGLPIPAFIAGEATLAGSAPIASFTPIPARPASRIDRGNFNHTLTFLIPAALCRGVLTITVSVFDAANPADRSRPETFTAYFDVVPVPRVYGVLINYTGMGFSAGGGAPRKPVNIPAPTLANLMNTLVYTTKTYPISGINLTGFQTVPFPGDLMDESGAGCGTGWNQLLSVLSNLRTQSNSTDVYVGILPTGVPNRNFSGCGGGTTGSAVAYMNDGPAMAQEIGHVFQRLHAPCGATVQNVDPNYPVYGTYPSGSIGEFGFDSVTNRVANPATVFDFMSYCGPKKWISPYTYVALKNAIVSGAALIPAPPPGPAGAVGEYLRLNFCIHDDGLVKIYPSFHLDGLVAEGESGPSTHVRCELLGPEDRLLESHLCQLQDPHQGLDAVELLLRPLIRWHPETQAIQFRRDGKVCHRHELPAAPPDISIYAPKRTGDYKENLSLEWKPARKSAALTYFLRFSHDGGATWRAIAANLTETCYVISLDYLPGGKDCRFQVVASSGVRTTVAETEPFALPVKAAVAYILTPSPDAVFRQGETVILRGTGFSPNFETLPFDDMQWSSRLDGHLGIGFECAASILSSGRHHITLCVPDGLGGEATAGIVVDVLPEDPTGVEKAGEASVTS